MKVLFLTCLTLMMGLELIAQQAETVYGLAKEYRSEDWYQTQEKLWKKELDAHPENANAWYNYYRSSRALRAVSLKDSDRALYADRCKSIVDDALKAVPNSFEANHMKWLEGSNDQSLFSYLKKAYDLNPKDERAYEDLATYYETMGDTKEYQKACKLMYQANSYPPSILNVAYNMLAEAEPNAILFTGGDNDTYACWVVQEGLNFRKDVRIINFFLIMQDDYRNKLFKELNLPAFVTPEIKSNEDWNKKQQDIIGHVLNHSAKHPVHVAVCAVAHLDQSLDDKLYLTGLTYRYSAEKFDNTATIIRNYEKRFLLDHLKQSFAYSFMEATATNFNASYLPSLVKLYGHYKLTEQLERAAQTRALITDLSKKTELEDEYNKLLESIDSH